MQYLTPLALSFVWMARISSLDFMFTPRYAYCRKSLMVLRRMGGIEIGKIQRRLFDKPALNQRTQILDQHGKTFSAFFRTGDTWLAGHTIGAGAVDRMRKHQPIGAIGIVGRLYGFAAHHVWLQRQHQ